MDDWADGIFGSSEPLSAKKGRKAEAPSNNLWDDERDDDFQDSIPLLLPRNEEAVKESDVDDDDDVPLLSTNMDDEDEFQSDDDIIDLSQDKEEYDAPLEQLQEDMMTQFVADNAGYFSDNELSSEELEGETQDIIPIYMRDILEPSYI